MQRYAGVKKTVVVSFEGDKVRVLYATRAQKGFVIEDGVTVSDSIFDDFLKQEKTRSFIVVKSFTQFFCDTFTIPPVPDNLLTSVIENEIRKVSKMEEFKFIYAVLGEKVVEQKKVKEIFVYAVAMEHIQPVVDRFMSHGKVIDALYPDVFAIAGFVGSGKDTVLGVLETETNKHLFVVQEGQVLFVRVVQAFDVGMRDHDMQNVNMTVNYCRQNLRLNPQRIVLVGHLCRNFFVRSNIGIPIVSFTHPVFGQRIRGQHAAVDYTLPIAALFIDKKVKIDILPERYRTLFQVDRGLRYGAAFFCILALCILLQAGFIINGIADARDYLAKLRRNLPNVTAVLQRYTIESDRFNAYRPLLESFRRNASLPDVYTFLQQLSDVIGEAATLVSISASTKENTDSVGRLTITIKGAMHSDDFLQMQRHYQRMITAIQTLSGFHMIDQVLDLKTKQWSIHGEIE